MMFCYSLGDLIITPTEYSRRLLTGYSIRKPIVAMSNGIDTGYFHPDKRCRASFRRRYGLEDNDRVVISVGHYIRRKGLPEFVELARKLTSLSDAGRDTTLERSFGNIAEKLRCCCEELLDKEEEFAEEAAGQHV